MRKNKHLTLRQNCVTLCVLQINNCNLNDSAEHYRCVLMVGHKHDFCSRLHPRTSNRQQVSNGLPSGALGL